MTMFGDQVYQYGGAPVNGFMTTGQVWFVKPSTGSDGNNGKKPSQAFKTLSKAQSMATADKGDVVYFVSESNTAANTTDYQSAVLAWAKDGVHLIGINSLNYLQQRSRIAQLSTATNVDDLFTVSADNCYIANISVFHGVADATSKGAVLVSGQRNRFHRVTMSGIGHATMDTADNYSLKVTGSENDFTESYIGLSTIARGTATYEMTLASGATRNRFEKCTIDSYASAAGYVWLKVASGGIDRWTLFDDCMFINMPAGDAAGTAMTEGFDITGGGSPDGIIILKHCGFVGANTVEADTVSGKLMLMTYADAGDTGLFVDAT